MTLALTLTLPARPKTSLLAPVGLTSPAATWTGVTVTGAQRRDLHETRLDQTVMLLAPTERQVTLRYAFDVTPGAYPEAAFAVHDSCFTRAAPALADEARGIVAAEGVAGFVAHVTRLFDYGHVPQPFYAGATEIPQLCDMATGSCVDINTYLVSGLRAAGVETAYLTGYFIPAERRDHTTDMHCWVATRVGGQEQHWDIAHHLKMGQRDVRPALNPKPGVRVAVSHAMGWRLPELEVSDAKLLSEPVWIVDGAWQRPDLSIRFDGYDALDAAQNAAALA